jgi:NADH-quinone oxidoreductase subunit B
MGNEGGKEKVKTAKQAKSNFEKNIRKVVKRKPISTIRNWGISYSLWPVHFTTACCGTEFAAAFCPRYDAERFGALPFLGARQCNVIFIEGTLTKKMAEAAKIVYAQMPEPKFVVAMGACAIDGGIFWNSYNIVRPDEILPIDVYIPGCPPRPEGVLKGIMMTREKIRKRGTPYPET